MRTDDRIRHVAFPEGSPSLTTGIVPSKLLSVVHPQKMLSGVSSPPSFLREASGGLGEGWGGSGQPGTPLGLFPNLSSRTGAWQRPGWWAWVVPVGTGQTPAPATVRR